MSWNGNTATEEKSDRNWLPIIIATSAVLLIGLIAVLTLGRGKPNPSVAAINAAPDPYAASLPLTDIKMSEAGNIAGGKETYIEGKITNSGSSTVTFISAQLLFRNFAHEVTRNESLPLRLIRTRTPYTDIQPISASPLKPGQTREFQLIIEQEIPDWDGAYPEIKILKVEKK